MKKILLEMLADLKEIKKSKKYIAPRVEPPTSPDRIDLKEVPELLKTTYTLIEFYLAKINEDYYKKIAVRDKGLLVELELKREIAVNIFKHRFREKYGNNENISLYSDWHAWKVTPRY